MPISGTCHCGNVEFELDDQPEWLTECNCSICRRLGALWAHSAIKNISISTQANATITYAHGDKNLAFHTCKTCGCTTHWENLKPDDEARMAVNMKLAEPSVRSSIRVRHFDGANSWSYLD